MKPWPDRSRRSRLVGIAVVAVMALAAVSATALLVLRSEDPAISSTKGRTAHPAMTKGGAEDLARWTTSGRQSDVGRAVALPEGRPLDESALAGRRGLDPLTFDLESFETRDRDHATVDARVGADQSRWVVTLVWSGGRWKISSTRQDRSS